MDDLTGGRKLTSPECRRSVLAYERRFADAASGAVNLVALFDSLREHPVETQLYIQASREMRGERRALNSAISTQSS